MKEDKKIENFLLDCLAIVKVILSILDLKPIIIQVNLLNRNQSHQLIGDRLKVLCQLMKVLIWYIFRRFLVT